MFSNNTEQIQNLDERILRNLLSSKLQISVNYKIAFTLAEVLITLLILGVVASLTIPAIIQNTQDKELYITWRKVFGDISQATTMLSSNNGINFAGYDTFRDSYANVMNFTKQDITKNIFASSYYNYKNPSSQGWDASGDTAPAVILPNGVLIRFESNYLDSNCQRNSGSLTGLCGFLTLDINGKKGPNMFGKDLYRIWIANENGDYTIYAWGNDDGHICQAGSTAAWTSDGCSVQALYKDQMP